MNLDDLKVLMTENDSLIQAMQASSTGITPVHQKLMANWYFLQELRVAFDSIESIDMDEDDEDDESAALLPSTIDLNSLRIKIQAILAVLSDVRGEYESASSESKAEKKPTYKHAVFDLHQALHYGIRFLDDKYDRGFVEQLVPIAEIVKLDLQALNTVPAASKDAEKDLPVLTMPSGKQAAAAATAAPAPLPFKTIIDNLSRQYEDDYRTRYGSGFWKRIKEFFRNKNRAGEIQFLKNVSNAEACTEEMRLAAIKLVHDKITRTEFFGRPSCFGRGSILRDKLSTIIRNHPSATEASKSDLIAFCDEHHPTLQIPASLETYLRNTMSLNSLQALIIMNEAELHTLKRRYRFDVKNAGTLSTGTRCVDWVYLSKGLHKLHADVQAAKEAFEAGVIPGKADAYQRALLNLNTAIGYGIDYLRLNKENIPDQSYLSNLAREVRDSIATLGKSLESTLGEKRSPSPR
jgi:hypothetical protein